MHLLHCRSRHRRFLPECCLTAFAWSPPCCWQVHLHYSCNGSKGKCTEGIERWNFVGAPALQMAWQYRASSSRISWSTPGISKFESPLSAVLILPWVPTSALECAAGLAFSTTSCLSVCSYEAAGVAKTWMLAQITTWFEFARWSIFAAQPFLRLQSTSIAWENASAITQSLICRSSRSHWHPSDLEYHAGQFAPNSSSNAAIGRIETLVTRRGNFQNIPLA